MADQHSSTFASDTGDSIGGDLSLDFANTISWDPSDPCHGERFHAYQDVVDWSLSRRLVSGRTCARLLKYARTTPQEAEGALRAARELRGQVHAIFAACAAGARPPPVSLRAFNDTLGDLSPRLRSKGGAVTWDWQIGPPDLTSVLRPVVWAGAELLRSRDLERVKICAGDRCGWLFVDRSRRHNRRWCDMRDCGNRAKVRRHYYRHRGMNSAAE